MDMNAMKKNSRGFTLVELMIVVAIIGILAAVGYPSYQNSVMKAQRADAIDALLVEAGRIEEYYLINDTYDGTTAFAVANSGDSAEGFYKISVSGVTDFAYLLTATRTPATDPDCPTLTLNQLGAKAPAACW